MVNAVFDTNVLASGILGISRQQAGAPGDLLRHWIRGTFVLIVSESILVELEGHAFATA